TKPLLLLVRQQRGATSGTAHLTAPELLRYFSSILASARGAPDAHIAIARTLAAVMSPGPDASGAVGLLRDAGIDVFDLEDLEATRKHPATSDVRTSLTSQECRDRFDAGMVLLLHDLAVEAGRPIGAQKR